MRRSGFASGSDLVGTTEEDNPDTVGIASRPASVKSTFEEAISCQDVNFIGSARCGVSMEFHTVWSQELSEEAKEPHSSRKSSASV